jgi:hypothetical protein
VKRTALIGLLAAALYDAHRLGRRSGVDLEEIHAALPGDAIVADPMWESTRAITIDASPEEIWPWIVQMGFPTHRAGWYTPPWLDRLTFGICARSSDEIRADLQQIEPGDQIPDSDDWSVYFTVVEVDAPRALVLHSTRHVMKPIRTADFSWAFVLWKEEKDQTRLIVRARVRYTPGWAAPFVEFVIGIGDYANAGAMLHGIKTRAEHAGHGQTADRLRSMAAA